MKSFVQRIARKLYKKDSKLTMFGAYIFVGILVMMGYSFSTVNYVWLFPLVIVLFSMIVLRHISQLKTFRKESIEFKKWNFDPIEKQTFSKWLNYTDPVDLDVDIDFVVDLFDKERVLINLFYLYHIESTKEKSRYQVHVLFDEQSDGISKDQIAELANRGLKYCDVSDVRQLFGASVKLDNGDVDKLTGCMFSVERTHY